MPEIIYEDENVLVINKPAGLLVHAAKEISKSEFLLRPRAQDRGVNSKQITLADWLVERYPNIKDVGDEPSLRPGIVHRLDKDTSGVMVIAKNQETFEYLKNQFQNRKIEKTYTALVKGVVKENKGEIKLAIGRSLKNPMKKSASPKAKGRLREAVTEYKIIKRFSVPEVRLQGIPKSDFKDYTLLEVYPKTGRTHQIRVHLKAINHPVVCDKLYTKNPDCPFGLERQFLHASSLELTLPGGGRIKLEADLPEDLRGVLKSLKEYDRT